MVRKSTRKMSGNAYRVLWPFLKDVLRDLRNFGRSGDRGASNTHKVSVPDLGTPLMYSSSAIPTFQKQRGVRCDHIQRLDLQHGIGTLESLYASFGYV